MSNTDEGKPAGKSGRRSRKGESKKGESKKTAAKKGPPESPAPVQLQSPDQDKQLQPQPVHTEFVKRAYETSVAESQKICELHNKLARQTFQPLQELVGKTRETRGKS